VFLATEPTANTRKVAWTSGSSYYIGLQFIIGPKRDEVTGEWRRLHNEELNDLYSSPDIIWGIKSRRMRWAGHVAHMGEGRGAYRIMVGRPEGR
jgi:hypothetical protein